MPAELKCRDCKAWKPAADFATAGPNYSASCHECLAARSLRRQKARGCPAMDWPEEELAIVAEETPDEADVYAPTAEEIEERTARIVSNRVPERRAYRRRAYHSAYEPIEA